MRAAMFAAAAAALVAALAPGAARADTGFASKLQVYADSDHTTVVSPIVQAKADVNPETNVTAGYTADVVTSASIDVVTQASKTTIHDTRHQVALGASRILGTYTAHANYSYSEENDYQSNSITGSLDKDLFDKNTTLSVGYALSLNNVGRSGDMNFSRPLTVQSVSAAWTQVVSQRLITQLTYELGYSQGFQASVYRFVPVRASLDAAPDYWVPETDPDTRFRQAIVFGVNKAVGDDASVQADYRLYHDTWGITSHTFGLRYFVNLGRKLELRLRNRLYTQNGANFYQDVYTMPQQYMAYDRELSPLWSETFGVKLTYALTNRIEGELKSDFFYYSYADFPPLANRVGTNTGIGLSITY